MGVLLLALAVLSAVTTAPARAAACGGRPAMAPGCCCKAKAPAPAKAPCCQAAPATSDAAALSGVTGVAPDLTVATAALLPAPPRITEADSIAAVLQASPPGSPPVFLLDCTFRI